MTTVVSDQTAHCANGAQYFRLYGLPCALQRKLHYLLLPPAVRNQSQTAAAHSAVFEQSQARDQSSRATEEMFPFLPALQRLFQAAHWHTANDSPSQHAITRPMVYQI